MLEVPSLTCYMFNKNKYWYHSARYTTQVEPGHDRFDMIRLLIDVNTAHFDKCAKLHILGSVDEQIIPFKGRHSL